MPVSGTSTEPLPRTGVPDLETRFSPSPRWLDAVQFLLARWRRLAIWTIAAILISIGLSFLFPFKATTQLMPPDSNSGGGLAGLLPSLARSNALALPMANDLLGIKTTGALFSKVLTSETVLDRLVDRFELMRHYSTSKRFVARDKLASRTSVEEDKKSGVLTLTVSDRDPQLAQAIANAYVEELNKLMARVATSAARREREFIEQRLTDEKKSLEDAEQRFSRFASSSMALDVPEQTRVMVESAARLQGELIAARAELQSVEQIYAPENPRVKSLRARVAELQREADKLNTGTIGSTGTSSSNPYPPVSKLPALGVQWTNLYRDTKIHETIYEMLTQQYESARIQEVKEIPTAKVLDYALVPEHRTPFRRTVVIGGAVLGLFLAIAGALLQWWWSWLPSTAPPRLLWNTVFHRRWS